jgi:hypothetical protein
MSGGESVAMSIFSVPGLISCTRIIPSVADDEASIFPGPTEIDALASCFAEVTLFGDNSG